jgi:hypothetical protein
MRDATAFREYLREDPRFRLIEDDLGKLDDRQLARRVEASGLRINYALIGQWRRRLGVLRAPATLSR